jgi:hypothetical protein
MSATVPFGGRSPAVVGFPPCLVKRIKRGHGPRSVRGEGVASWSGSK